MDLFAFMPQELTSGTGMFLTVLTIIFYFAESFFGYKFIRSWISAIGCIFGAYAGFKLALFLTNHTGYALIGAILGGLVLSILSYRVYLVGIYLVTAFAVYQLGITYLPLADNFTFILSILLGLLAGYLAVKFMRPAIICITAFHGAAMAASLLPQFIALPAGISILTAGIILGIAGAAVQYFTTK